MYRIISLVFAIVIGLSGCGLSTATYENRYFPVKSRIERESSLGFSITPPSGTGWYEKVHKDSLYYLKNIKSDNYKIYTKTEELRLKKSPKGLRDFVDYVVKMKSIDVTKGLYKNHNFIYFLDVTLSPYCVRYTQSYEDYNHEGLGSKEFVRVSNGGLVCMHPDTPAKGVDMHYNESSLSTTNQTARSYKNEGENFLSSLRFM